MPFFCSRLWVFGVCAALVAGCGGSGSTTGSGGSGGGGGGGGGTTSTTVTFTFSGPNVPVLVAAKIGTGAFSAQTLSGSTLTLSIPSGTSNYAVAYLCSSQFEIVWEASIADGTSPSESCPSVQSQTGTLTGSLDATAIPDVQYFYVNSQNASSVSSDVLGDAQAAAFSQPGPVGNDRVLVVAYNSQGASVAAKNFDSQTVPGALNGGNKVVFSAADETTPTAITYNNVPSGFSSPSTSVYLATAGGSQTIAYGGGTTQYPALPAAVIENGDAYFFEASSALTSGGVYSEVSTETTTSGGPLSITFPAPWSYAGLTPAALPSFAIGYSGFAGKTNVVQQAMLLWQPGIGTSLIFVNATADYQGGSTTLAVPDLSGVSGFVAPPASGKSVEWTASVTQQSIALWSKAPLNSTSSFVLNNGTYTVP